MKLPEPPPRRPPAAKYRFGFILGITLGNRTRFQNLRKFASRDPDVECTWTPVDHYVGSSGSRLLQRLPDSIGIRLWVAIQMYAGLRRLGRFDAVMTHLFEAETLCALRSYVWSRPALISSTDEAPIVDPDRYPLYPKEAAKRPWRRRLRLRLDRWRASRMQAFVPFTRWGADILAQGCGIPADLIHPIHVGLDLDVWTRRESRPAPATRLNLLFVGSDFERKGGDLLLRVVRTHFSEQVELHLVTNQAPAHLPASICVHNGLTPNDPRLIALYGRCDVFVLPTSADLVPWSILEAMAMECAVISCDVGAIPQIVEHGATGYIVPARDETALIAAIRAFVNDPASCRTMGEHGRSRVEQHYNAEINVPKILAVMKRFARRPDPNASA